MSQNNEVRIAAVSNEVQIAAVDFETTYDSKVGLSIKDMGVRVYADECEPYLVAIVTSDGNEFCGHPAKFEQLHGWNSLDGYLLVSHNAAFDIEVLLSCVRRGVANWPDFLDWQCTANLAAFLGCDRSLQSACKTLLDVEVSKDVRKLMDGLSVDAMKTRPSVDGRNCFYDDVVDYALHDSRLCLQLWQTYGESMPELEKQLSSHTVKLSSRGIPIDLERIASHTKELHNGINTASKLLPWCAGNDSVVLSPKKLAAACREVGIEPPAKLDEESDECKDWEEKYGEAYPWVGAMRTVRKSNLLMKRLEVIKRRSSGKRFYCGLKYFGAHTGRWSGSSGFNLQNFPKEKTGNVDLRACVRAEKGKKLIIADLAQIEARVTPYLAGDTKTIDLIRTGMSVYEVHARLTMGFNGEKTLKETDRKKYEYAKCRVLGLGFGCGPIKFRDMATRQYKIELSADEAKQAVYDFRAKNPKIVALWKQLDADFRKSKGKDFQIELPSGRCLNYFNVHESGTSSMGPQFSAQTLRNGPVKKLYGGLLTENLVQATARDVFGVGMLAVENAGHEVLFHVHDEIVVQVDKSVTPDEICELLTQPIDWMPNFPIGAEAVESDVYLK